MPIVRPQPGSTTPGLGQVPPNSTTPGLLGFGMINSKLCIVCSPLLPTSLFSSGYANTPILLRSVWPRAKSVSLAAKDGPKVLCGIQGYAYPIEGTGSYGSSRGAQLRTDASSGRPSEFPLSVTLNSAGP